MGARPVSACGLASAGVLAAGTYRWFASPPRKARFHSKSVRLPVLDVSLWLSEAGAAKNEKEASSKAKAELVAQARRACEKTGFLAVTNLPRELRRALRDARDASRRFFKLVRCQGEDGKGLKAKLVEANKEIWPDINGLPRAYGYFPMKSEALGYEADVVSKPDLREAFSVGPQRVSEHFMKKFLSRAVEDLPFGADFPTDVARFLFQTTPWPNYSSGSSGGFLSEEEEAEKKVVEEFRAALLRFYKETSKLGAELLRILAEALGLETAHFQEAAREGHHCNSARVILYPKLTTEAIKGQLRCGAHSDTGALTLLWSDTPGLELKPLKATKDGKGWHSVESMLRQDARAFGDDNTMIVNIGDLLEHMSKGRWKSTPHRVPAPRLDSPENRDRIALVTFIILAPDFQVDPATGLTQGEHAFSHFIRKGRNAPAANSSR